MNPRPVGVAILSILTMLSGILFLFIMFMLLTDDTPPKVPPPFSKGALTALVGGLAVFYLVFGQSLYRGHTWSWWFNNVALANGLALQLGLILVVNYGGPEVSESLKAQRGAYTGSFSVNVAVYFLLLLYFLKRDVLDFFNLQKSKYTYLGILLIACLPSIAGVSWLSKRPVAEWQNFFKHDDTPELSGPIVALNDAPAYNPDEPRKQIGVFQKATKLTVVQTGAADGMTLVEFVQPDGKSIHALCKVRDLGPDPAAAVSETSGPASEGPPPAAAAARAYPDDTWASKPPEQWPQIVLTNEAEFSGHTPLHGASAFLVRRARDGRVFAVTAKHLLGSDGGVEPRIYLADLNGAIRSWKMFPRTRPESFVQIVNLSVADGLNRGDLDWLVFNIRPAAGSLPAQPLRIRKEPAAVGEKICLIGCPYSEPKAVQNTYFGKVIRRDDANYFSFSLNPPVDLHGFSGAPIVDEKGLLVGMMTTWFEPKMSGDKFLEGAGQDASAIHPLVER